MLALSCVLSFPLSVCLSFFLTYILMPPTVRSVYDVSLPFLLNNNTIHWRALTRHLFSECEWITFQYCLTIKEVQVFKQIPYMLSESPVTPQSANMPLQSQMAFKGDRIYIDFIYIHCVCVCVYGWVGVSLQIEDSSKIFGTRIRSSIKNQMVPLSFIV